MDYHYKETKDKKMLHSEKFNCVFDKNDGTCITWGETIEDDVDFCPFGPLILDMEITTICKGVGGKLCKMCYKSNTSNGQNMSFNVFKKIVDTLPKFTQQIAFGVDSHADSNPDIWKMFEYCRSINIVPNLTVAEITDATADKIAQYAGACAVSVYDNKNIAYDSIKKLTDRGMKQVNIHFCIYKDSFKRALEIIDDMKTDSRLEKMNAVVFLSLKKKGRGKDLKTLTVTQFDKLVKKCLDEKIMFGFDSCSGSKAEKNFKKTKNEHLLPMITGCESTMQSFYINVEGIGFPCSFTEGEKEWVDGIDMKNNIDFVQDVWYNDKVVEFRKSLEKSCGVCPKFKV